MKKQSRILAKGSKTAAASQPKTAQSPAHIQPAGTVTCVFYDANGREWARVDFPRDVFALIKRSASKLGITLAQFFHNAIRHYNKTMAFGRAA